MVRIIPVVRSLCGKIEELGSFIFLAIKSRQNFNRQLNRSSIFSTGSCSSGAHPMVCNQIDCLSSLSSLNLDNSGEQKDSHNELVMLHKFCSLKLWKYSCKQNVNMVELNSIRTSV